MKFTLSGFQSTCVVFEKFLFQCSISGSHSSDYEESVENAKADMKPKTEYQSSDNLCDTSWTCQTPQRWKFNYGTLVER